MNQTMGDQTRGDSTPFFSGVQPVKLSLNEVAVLCMKASRGAGMSWGLAEEAGFAASWLTEHGYDGPGFLLDHLSKAQGSQWVDLCPIVGHGAWQAQIGHALCPIALGAALCDHAALPTGPVAGCGIEVGPVNNPVLLIPFLADIASAGLVQFSLKCEGETININGRDAALKHAVHTLTGQDGVLLHLTGQPADTVQRPTISVAPHIASQTIAALNTLAMRTTVPASDASRAGAGAAASDND